MRGRTAHETPPRGHDPGTCQRPCDRPQEGRMEDRVMQGVRSVRRRCGCGGWRGRRRVRRLQQQTRFGRRRRIGSPRLAVGSSDHGRAPKAACARRSRRTAPIRSPARRPSRWLAAGTSPSFRALSGLTLAVALQMRLVRDGALDIDRLVSSPVSLPRALCAARSRLPVASSSVRLLTDLRGFKGVSLGGGKTAAHP